jgi:integrase
MASAYIARDERGGPVRFKVLYRLGGRESKVLHGGSFRTKRLAEKRRDWIAGELANLRVPDLRALEASAPEAPAVAALVHAWRDSRRDVSAGTRQTYDVALARIAHSELGDLSLSVLDASAVDRFVGELDDAELARESIRKTLGVLAQALDWHGLEPNPARDRRIVRLPAREHEPINPPTADHLEAVFSLLPAAHRLPLVVLDATGMRVGELEALTWGDIDEPRGRWRVKAGTSKTRRARWVPVPESVLVPVCELVPRDDRDLDARVFSGFGADRFRTALARACRAAGVPAFSPHDLRHRRISLLHLGGVPWARIGERVGQRSLAVTADTYTHVLVSERELDYQRLVAYKP